MDNISPHITYEEATRSETATRLGLDNTPNAEQLSNMKAVAIIIFENVREHFGKPIAINSFFRSEAVNSATKGSSKTSQHCEGKAIDMSGTPYGISNAEIFYHIKKDMIYDQLIWEFGDEKEPLWVHVSYSAKNNRCQALKSVIEKGKTVYNPA